MNLSHHSEATAETRKLKVGMQTGEKSFVRVN